MFLVREIMHCKPGKAGEIVKRFKQLQPMLSEMGFKEPPRVMTDMSGERFWTVISEQPVESLTTHHSVSGNSTRQHSDRIDALWNRVTSDQRSR